MRTILGLSITIAVATLAQGCVLKSDLDVALSGKTTAEQELAATQVTLNKTRDAIAELEAEVGEFRTLFDGAQIQNANLSAQITNLGNQVGSIKNRLGTTQSRVTELSALSSEDRTRRIAARDLMATLQVGLTQAQEQFSTILAEYELEQATRATERKRFAGLDRTRVLLAKRINQLQAANKLLQAQKDEAMALAKQLAEEKTVALGTATNLDKQKSTALSRIAALENKQSRLATERERLAQDVALLQADKEVLNEELKSANKTLADESTRTKNREQEARTLIEKLERDLSTQKVKISRLSGLVKVDLDNSILFAAGSSTVGKEGKKALGEVVEALASSAERVIRVYGHTDNTTAPEGAHYRDNWGLSALRAASVVSFLVDSGVNPQDIAAVGFGATRPITDNGTREGRDQNRRIEIVLAPKIATGE